jgi:hypothetical protein
LGLGSRDWGLWEGFRGLGRQLKRDADDEMSVIVDTGVWIDSFNPKIKTPENWKQ